MPDRRVVYVLELPELLRLVADAQAGIADIDEYIGDRTSVWTATTDLDGRDVDVLVLHPSWQDPTPRSVVIQ